MKIFPDFENELKAIDPRLSVVRNPNYPQLANIKIEGTDICPIPSEEIFEKYDPSYTIMMSNGWKMPHKSQEQAIAQVKDTIEKLKDPEYYNIFFDK